MSVIESGPDIQVGCPNRKIFFSSFQYYFHDDTLGQTAGDRIQSLEAKEIISIVWEKMPPFTELSLAKMKASC